MLFEIIINLIMRFTVLSQNYSMYVHAVEAGFPNVFGFKIVCLCCLENRETHPLENPFPETITDMYIGPSLPVKIIYFENLMLEPMNCAMKMVA